MVSCSEHDCPREVTEWKNIGNCQGIGENKTCGDGIQNQTRNCKDGTTEKCLDIELMRALSCNETGSELPKCKGNEMIKYILSINNFKKYMCRLIGIRIIIFFKKPLSVVMAQEVLIGIHTCQVGVHLTLKKEIWQNTVRNAGKRLKKTCLEHKEFILITQVLTVEPLTTQNHFFHGPLHFQIIMGKEHYAY